jgi:hypothetical protein
VVHLVSGGTFPVPSVKSTRTFTTAGPQAPLVPAMLHRVMVLDFSLQSISKFPKIANTL